MEFTLVRIDPAAMDWNGGWIKPKEPFSLIMLQPLFKYNLLLREINKLKNNNVFS